MRSAEIPAFKLTAESAGKIPEFETKTRKRPERVKQQDRRAAATQGRFDWWTNGVAERCLSYQRRLRSKRAYRPDHRPEEPEFARQLALLDDYVYFPVHHQHDWDSTPAKKSCSTPTIVRESRKTSCANAEYRERPYR